MTYPILSLALPIALSMLVLAMVLALVRLLKGPSAQDRVLALDCMYLNGMLLALVLVGVTLSGTRVGDHLKGALGLTLIKNLAFPALVAGLSWSLGLSGLPLTVMIVAASLPIGANVFLFSQRYNVAEELVTASVAVSTGMALITVSLVMALVNRI